MKPINIIRYILLVFLLFGCMQKPKQEKPVKINGSNLYALINNALWGSEESNYKLSGLVNPDTPSPGEFNKFFIDSVKINGQTFYSVMIEYPNPLYNILAVYDNELNLYLLDTSLNGNFAIEWKNFDGNNYLIAYEKFISKDILKIERVSLYKKMGPTLKKVYRGFSKLTKSGKEFSQTITEINENFLKTKLSGNQRVLRKTKVDTFYYDELYKKYVSKKDVFDKFVLDAIKKAKWKIEKSELTIETAGLTKGRKLAETIDANDLSKSFKGYQINLSNDWKVLKDLTISEHLKQKFKGTRFLNEKLGAQITIIKIPDGLTAEQYLKYKLGKATKGNYKVRSSELFEIGKNFLQFYEHSCGKKHFLMMFEVPINSYKSNKNIYDDIQTSFFIEC